MRMRIILLVILVGITRVSAQNAGRTTNASINPCPGGKGLVHLDVAPVYDLEGLVQYSQLIIRGRVVSSLPAFSPSPNHLNDVETDSLVAIEEIFSGAPPTGAQMISLFQIGGKAGPCAEVVPDDPLVQVSEQYMLFLVPDNRKVPNISGSPRYAAIGVWSGKAKIEGGKIQFLPAVLAGLRKYNNTDENAFVAILKDRIGIYKKRP